MSPVQSLIELRHALRIWLSEKECLQGSSGSESVTQCFFTVQTPRRFVEPRPRNGAHRFLTGKSANKAGNRTVRTGERPDMLHPTQRKRRLRPGRLPRLRLPHRPPLPLHRRSPHRPKLQLPLQRRHQKRSPARSPRRPAVARVKSGSILRAMSTTAKVRSGTARPKLALT
jgi:hypothetical protein